MGSTMSHEYKCGSIFCSCFHAVISSFFYSFICDCLSNSSFVIVDNGSVIANLTKHWFSDCYRFKFIFVSINSFYHLIVLSTMHKMCRLNYKILNTVCYCTVKCLLHVINLLIISCLYMVDNDLSGKCSSYRPIRECFCKSILDSFDILCTAVVKGSTKAYYKKLILTDLVLITRIILGSITCVTSEILWTCLFSLYKLFLSICKGIPCFFSFLALLICIICSLLNINSIDKCCYFISRFLICICSVISCFCIVCCLSIISCFSIVSCLSIISCLSIVCCLLCCFLCLCKCNSCCCCCHACCHRSCKKDC